MILATAWLDTIIFYDHIYAEKSKNHTIINNYCTKLFEIAAQKKEVYYDIELSIVWNPHSDQSYWVVTN